MNTPLVSGDYPRTKDGLMAAFWELKVCTPFDNPGTVRTGRAWFDRYMLYPWEHTNDFELVG